MSNTKTTKRALLTSIMALMLCFAMLTGTTFAWFTDTETSSNNRIVAGTLDVDLQMDKAEDGNYVSIAGGSGDIFKEGANANDSTATLWEPGKTQVVYLAVANLGNLALKYNIVLNVTDEDTTDAVNLADVLEFAVVDYGKDIANVQRVGSWDASAAVPTLGSLLVDGKVVAAPNGQLEIGKKDYFALAVHMQEEAGNEYQGKSISIDVTVVATQLNAEEDSFGKDYDEDADYPVASVPVSIPTEDVTDPITLNANGMEVEVPAAVINNLPAEVTQISLTYSASAVEDDTITFASVKLVDQNGNEIELDGSNGSVAVTLPAQTTFGAGQLVYVYHDSKLVATPTVNADGTISYEAAHFCDVAVYGKYTEEYFLPAGVTAETFGTNVAYTNGVYYATLSAALKAIHNSDATDSALYLKPNTDLGAITHAHVCSNVAVYGNGSYISGGERDFEIGFPQAGGMSCTTMDSDVTLSVYDLDGCAVWGVVPAGANVNVYVNDCENVSKIVLHNSTYNGNLNISVNNCTFVGTDAYRDSAVWCEGLNNLEVNSTTFKNFAVGINQNNKNMNSENEYVQNYTLTDCTFVDCATSTYVTTQTSYAAPIRAVASASDAIVNLTLNNCKFEYTTAETAINGDILTYQDGNAGTVYVVIDGVAQ